MGVQFAGNILVQSNGGPLPISSGGTGQTTAATAINALLPTQTGESGKVLTTNGTNVSWSGSILTPGGADTQIQFNDAGTFGGNAFFTVNKSTGALTSSSTFSGIGINISDTAGTLRTLGFRTAGSDRWLMQTNTVAESGSNVGSNFQFSRVADNGSTSNLVYTVSRATGVVDFKVDPTVNGSPIGGVASFNTRTGAITLTSGDVTTALTFTPYDATNPSGYTTNTGTVTSVSGTGTVSGLTLTGSVTTSGSLTLGGTLSLTSGNVTTALGYTPYNATNPSGYTTNTGTVTSVAALTLGTSGTDLSSSVATGTTTPVITLNVPTASASNRGVLSAADWSTFNSKGSGTVTSVSGTGTVSGLTLTGSVTTSGSLTLGGTLSLTSGNVTTALGYTPINKVGDTMSGSLTFASGTVTGLATPTAGTDATTKNYVDAAVAGLSWKLSVLVATTANITLSGTQTIDGVAVTAGNRVLVKNQTTTSANGIYVAAAGAWARSADSDSAAEIDGSAVYVQQGTTQADTGWTETAIITTVGTDPVVYAQFSGSGSYTAGTGLSLTGNTFANTGVTSNVAGTNVTVSGATGAVTIGLVTAPILTGTNFTAIPNAALTNSSVTVNGTAIALGASGTVAAAAGTLTGATLAVGVTASSLTSVGTLANLTVTNPITGSVTGNAGTVTNGVYTTSTGTVTNTMLAGSIANAKLLNSSVTVGSTNIALGSTSTILAGLTSVTSTTFVGALTGNASTATTAGTVTTAAQPTITSVGTLTSVTVSGTATATSVSVASTGQVYAATLTTSATTANQVVASAAIATYRSVKYVISITSGSAYQYTEVAMIHDGTNVHITENCTVRTGATLATFTADISSGNMRLLTTPVNAVTVIKSIVTAIVV